MSGSASQLDAAGGNGSSNSLWSRCEQWLANHEWTTTPDAHSLANYETFERCLEHLRSGLLLPDEAPERSIAATGIHHPVLLALHRSSFPPFSIRAIERLEACQQEALQHATELSACCDGRRVCFQHAEHQAECCAALSNRAGDDPPVAFVTPAFDVHLGSRLRSQKSFNVQESWALQSLVPEGGFVVDAGANIGAYTIPLAHRVGRSGRVLAFEPFRLLFQLLTANVALNGLTNVFTHQVALGDAPGTVSVHGPDLSTYNLVSSFQVKDQGYSERERGWTMKYAEEAEVVRILPLDAYLQELPRLDLLKVDVEDMEEAVVLGARQTLAQHRPKVWVENAKLFEHSDQTFVLRMATLGYLCEPYPGMDWELLCLPKS